MQELAVQYSIDPREAFTLGLLHDIGYEFCDKQSEHANKGGLLLKEQGYKYWKEVFYHGIPQNEYASNMLSLLNYADMVTGPDGTSMTVQERIDDIADRYGNDSEQVENAVNLAKMLGVTTTR